MKALVRATALMFIGTLLSPASIGAQQIPAEPSIELPTGTVRDGSRPAAPVGLVFSAAMGTGLPFGFPPAEAQPSVLSAAPDSPAFFLCWGKVATPSSASSNRTEQLLAEPEVRHLFNQVAAFVRSAFEQGARSGQDDESVEAVTQLMETLLTHSTAVSLQLQPQIRFSLVCDTGEHADDVHEMIAKLPQSDSIEPFDLDGNAFFRVTNAPTDIVYGLVDDKLMIGSGEDEIKATLARLKAGNQPPWLQDTLDRLSVERIGNVCYINPAQLSQSLSPDGGTFELLPGMDLSAIESVACVSGFDRDATVVRTWFRADVPPALANLVRQWELQPDDFDSVPADARFALAFKVAPQVILESLAALVSIADGIPPDEAKDELRHIADRLNLDIEKDVLATLGNTWRLYESPSEGGALFTGWTLIVSVNDANRLRSAVSRMVQPILDDADVQLTEQVVESTTVYCLNSADEFPFSPSWCVTDEHLIVSTFPQGVSAVLQRKQDVPRLSHSSALQRRIGAMKPQLLLHIDEDAVAGVLHPLTQLGLAMAPNELPYELREAWTASASDLPSLPSLLAHLDDAHIALRVDSEGLELTRHQTLPPTGMQAVSAGLVIGEVMDAPFRELEQQLNPQVVATNNLRQLILALHIHHDVHNEFPAAASVDDDGKPLLSWRVQILPFLDQSDLYERFRLDEPWDSPHNKSLIAEMPAVYRSAESRAPEGSTTFVTVRVKDAIMPPDLSATSMATVTDGSSNTIAIVEASDRNAVPWTKPDDLTPSDGRQLANLLRNRNGTFLVAFTDGHATEIPAGLDAEDLMTLVTRNDGNWVDVSSLDAENITKRDMPAPPVKVADVAAFLDFEANNERVEDVIANAGSREAAAEVFEAIAKDSPEDYFAQYNLGTNQIELKQYEEAEESLSVCVRLRPDAYESMFQLGVAVFCLDRNDDAINLFDRAIELNPEASEAWLYRAMSHHSNGDTEQALPDYTRAIELNPQQGYAYYRRAEIHAQNERTDDAIADFSRAAELRPNDRNVFYFRSFQYKARGDLDKAVADLSRVLEMDPSDTNARYYRGGMFQELEEYLKAVRDFSVVIGAVREYEPAWSSRASCWFSLEEYDTAIADYDVAISLSPDKYNFANRGLCWENKKKYEQAVADYSEALKVDAEYEFALAQRAWCHWKLRKFELAKADYLSAIDAGAEDDAHVLGNASWLLASCPEDAVRDGRLALEFGSVASELTKWKEAWVIDNVAAAHAELGDFDKAIEYAEMAISVSKDDEEKADIQTRLRLYRKGQPARDD